MLTKKILLLFISILPIVIVVFLLNRFINSPEKSNIKYFGMALTNTYDYEGFTDYINMYKPYFNLVVIPLWIEDDGSLPEKTEQVLKTTSGYDKVALMLVHIEGKLLDMSQEERVRLYNELKSLPSFKNVNMIVVIDEPYLKGFTPERLEDAINEVSEAFPDKELAVNFANSGFSDGTTIPDRKLDYVSFDAYLCTTNEQEWKKVIREEIDFFKQKSNKPLIFVTQGWSRENCSLTSEKVEWSYEIAKEKGIKGLVFWFPENEWVGEGKIFRGFSHPTNSEAREKIIFKY